MFRPIQPFPMSTSTVGVGSTLNNTLLIVNSEYRTVRLLNLLTFELLSPSVKVEDINCLAQHELNQLTTKALNKSLDHFTIDPKGLKIVDIN